MVRWKKGDPCTPERGEGFLPGIPRIATFMGLSYSTVWNRIHEDGLPAWKEGRKWVSHKDLILQWCFAKASTDAAHRYKRLTGAEKREIATGMKGLYANLPDIQAYEEGGNER